MVGHSRWPLRPSFPVGKALPEGTGPGLLDSLLLTLPSGDLPSCGPEGLVFARMPVPRSRMSVHWACVCSHLVGGAPEKECIGGKIVHRFCSFDFKKVFFTFILN